MLHTLKLNEANWSNADKIISIANLHAKEERDNCRYEWIDGHFYPMAGASDAHNLIAGSIYANALTHLKGKPCNPFIESMKVQVGNNFYYPDVVVDCAKKRKSRYIAGEPVLIAEVLSYSTRQKDFQTKFADYIKIPTLQEYLIFEQTAMQAYVYRRASEWQEEKIFDGDILLDSLGLTFSLADIYDEVEFEV